MALSHLISLLVVVSVPTHADVVYYFPPFDKNIGIHETLWNKARTYYDSHWKSFPNRRYVGIVNLALHSTKKRFWILDLEAGTVESYYTSHGRGSDPNRDGYATRFSNDDKSYMSSLGAYMTGAEYNGDNGRSLYLDGLEATNSNARYRAIVIHGAAYVSEARAKAGLSLGCPALDKRIVPAVIDRLKDGAFLIIDSVK